MKLEGYGIVLTRLTARDLELVRVKRNSDEVRSFMRFQDEITPEMQMKWFASIDNQYNNYFLIHHGEEKVGLISGAEIDWENMETRNGGLFIWESSLWGTQIPFNAAILLTEFSFFIGFRRTFVRVLPDNKRAKEFNGNLGYVLSSTSLVGDLEQYELDEAHFFAATEKTRNILRKQYPGPLKCTIDDPKHPSSLRVISAYTHLPDKRSDKFVFIVNT